MCFCALHVYTGRKDTSPHSGGGVLLKQGYTPIPAVPPYLVRTLHMLATHLCITHVSMHIHIAQYRLIRGSNPSCHAVCYHFPDLSRSWAQQTNNQYLRACQSLYICRVRGLHLSSLHPSMCSLFLLQVNFVFSISHSKLIYSALRLNCSGLVFVAHPGKLHSCIGYGISSIIVCCSSRLGSTHV